MQGEEGTVASAGVRSRMDPRTGKRMYIHDAAFWQERVEERARLGESVRAYCAARGLAMNTFRRWVCRLRKDSKPAARTQMNKTFIEVPIAKAAQASGAGCAIEVRLGRGVRVKLEGEAALRALGLVLGRLEQAVQS